MKNLKTTLVFILLMVCFYLSAWAQVETSLLFTDGMVLQREQEIPVWGKGVSGQFVTVSISGHTATSQIDQNGKWQVRIPAMTAGGPYLMTITSGLQTLIRKDVYIGDVFLVSGQSNMEWPVVQSSEGATAIVTANNQTIRQFKVPKATNIEPQESLPTGSAWTPATSQYVSQFSAVAYYCARELQPYIGNVPIGLVNFSYGGARIEAFMSDEMLGYDEKNVVLAAGEPERQPTLIYNTMIKPLIGLPFKGFLWYQGESNSDSQTDAKAYGVLLQNMISSYRKLWGGKDFPFIWIQLPNYGTPAIESQPASSSWEAVPYTRKSMTETLKLPNTAQVVSIDLGNSDIHPPNKLPVGLRLAKAVRNRIYNQNVIYAGPTYSHHEILPNGEVLVTFNDVASGLMSKNPLTDSVNWFSLGKNDGSLVQAKAVILNKTQVLVSNQSMKDPDYMRYAFHNNPMLPQLYNDEDLPAAPFLVILKPDHVAPTAPSSLKTTNITDKNVNLSWEASTDDMGVKEYKVYRNKVLYKTFASNSAIVSGLSPSTSYTFYVTASDEFGNESNPSNEVNATTLDSVPSTKVLLMELEAENGTLVGVTTAQSLEASNGQYVTDFLIPQACRIAFNFEVPAEGRYDITIRYRAIYGDKINDLQVNDQSPVQVNFPFSTIFKEVNLTVQLAAGTNILQIIANWGYFDVDKISIYSDKAANQGNDYSKITAKLINPLISNEAQALYDFVKSQYGEKMMTGHTSDFYDKMVDITGKKPLVRGFDLLTYSPMYPYKYDNNTGGHTFGPVDNGEVDKAIDWYTNETNKKGVVTIHWHWFSPSGGQPGTNTFYTNQSTFDVEQAVIPGTKEYQEVLRDIDAIAVQLKKIQDRGVPVIWRPLHEAGGRWFWWGAKGPGPCLKLYDILYERLTHHHNIHNLIWSWATPEEDWYPGNDKVDMVGFDSYPTPFNYTIQKPIFDQLHKIVGGTKIVAMTENGPIPNLGEALEKDARWSWFLGWNDLVIQQNDLVHILDTYNHPLALTIENTPDWKYVPDLTAPTAPSDLTVTTVTANRIDLTWKGSADNVLVAGYNVYVNSTLYRTVTDTSLSITGLNDATSYTFYVTARDKSGNESARSNTVNATTPDATPPSIPKGLNTSNITHSSVTLSWDASTDNVGVVGYYVFVNDSFYSSTNATTQYIDGLTQGTTYSLTVAARDQEGNVSELSDEIMVTTKTLSYANIALHKPVTASSAKGNRPAKNANDDNNSTYWENKSLPASIIVDLGQSYDINQISINWGTSYGTTYTIEYSTDNITWATSQYISDGDGGTDNYSVSFLAKYIKVFVKSSNNGKNAQIYELEVYGRESGKAQLSARNTESHIEIQEEMGIIVYPNPAHDVLNINLGRPDSKTTISMYSTSGHLVYFSENKMERKIAVPVNTFQAGVYIIQIRNSEGGKTLKAIIK